MHERPTNFLMNGRPVLPSAPARQLQSALQQLLTANNNRIHENVRNALIIKAWNAFAAGRSVTRSDMKHAISDPLPTIDAKRPERRAWCRSPPFQLALISLAN
jgi:hypothetical protein